MSLAQFCRGCRVSRVVMVECLDDGEEAGYDCDAEVLLMLYMLTSYLLKKVRTGLANERTGVTAFVE